nr:uncharacterized protein LOC109186206 [Ipomoea batatas]
MVSALIDPATSDWDIPLLRELFCDRDIDLIRALPISTSFADQWCWRGHIKGLYTVRQGYKLMVEDATSDSTLFSAWKLLWNLKLPPKILNFVWRCARDILPLRTSLAGRGVNIDISCPLCNTRPESALHLFRQCVHTTSLWDSFQGLPPLLGLDNFAAWFSKLVDGKDEVLIRSCVALCWAIWNCRNELLWNNKSWSPGEVVRRAALVLEEWGDLQYRIC